MRRTRAALAVAVLAALPLAGCYHATVDTGRPPSGVTVDRPWAPSFIGGLVPPPVVETAQRCPNGIAKVDTQLSFLNMLVSGVTFGLFTPMHITVECAAAGTGEDSAMRVPVPGDATSVAETLGRAAERSLEEDAAVYVRLF